MDHLSMHTQLPSDLIRQTSVFSGQSQMSADVNGHVSVDTRCSKKWTKESDRICACDRARSCFFGGFFRISPHPTICTLYSHYIRQFQKKGMPALTQSSRASSHQKLTFCACFLHRVQNALQLRSAAGVSVNLMTPQMQVTNAVHCLHQIIWYSSTVQSESCAFYKAVHALHLVQSSRISAHSNEWAEISLHPDHLRIAQETGNLLIRELQFQTFYVL